MLPCVFVKYLGVECPGCGTQRAFSALLKGNILDSLNYNASVIPFLLLLIYLILHLIYNFKNGPKTLVIWFSSVTFILISQFVIKLILKG